MDLASILKSLARNMIFFIISKIPRQNCIPVNFPKAFTSFVESLHKDTEFDFVYETEQVVGHFRQVKSRAEKLQPYCVD